MAISAANTHPLNRLVQLALLFVLFQIFASCAVRSPSVPSDAPSQAVSCEVAWAGLSPDEYGYDFEQDVQLTSHGNEGYGAFAERVSRPDCRKAWTALIYMAADSEDMLPYAYHNLYNIEAAFASAKQSAASTLYADILVQLDLYSPEGIRRLHLFSTPDAYISDMSYQDFAQRSPLDIRSPIVSFNEDETTSPAESVRQFVDWAVVHYPAEHYLVIVWGHGEGWRSLEEGSEVASGGNVGGVALDKSQNTVLDIPSLHAALRSVVEKRLEGRPFDVLAWDGCLMQTVEVATELADVARYVIGTEQFAAYNGLPYRDLLPLLNGSQQVALEHSRCEPIDTGCRLAELLLSLCRKAVDADHYNIH